MKKIFLSLLLFALVFTGCYTSSTKGGLVGVNNKQLLLISANEMNQSAAEAYVQHLTSARSSNSLNKDIILTKRVREITEKLISKVGAFREDALKWDWETNVINQDVLNAWCMPGGKIVVYSGIIKRLNLNDAQLAAVLGHEIAHALREHSRERASADKIKDLGMFALQKTTDLDNSTMNLINIASHYTISLPFSRSNEKEADHIGTELMARAGYNPNEAIKVWEKMSKISENKTPEILSTHPSHESRINDLRQIATKVMPLYISAKR